MKRRVIYLTSMFIIVGSHNAQERKPAPLPTERDQHEPLMLKKAGLDDKTKKILAQFANVVLGFFNILQDPNNVAHVSAQVTDMINNAVNIVTESVKRGELSLDATEEELQQFAQLVVKRLNENQAV